MMQIGVIGSSRTLTGSRLATKPILAKSVIWLAGKSQKCHPPNIKDPNLNVQLEKDILNWMNQDKGVTRTNVKGWHSTTDMHTKPEYARLVKALHEAQNKIYDE